MSYIYFNPGCTSNEIASNAFRHVSVGTVRSHIRRLRREGINIVAHSRCYYIEGLVI